MKRHRNTNFTGQEKELLLTLFNKYKSTIENKRTDGATTHEKNKVWEILTQQFNSLSTPSLNNRSVDSLNIFYKNFKKCLRMKAGEIRKETYLTGGGPPSTELSESENKLLAIFNKKTVFGLTNPFDSDGDGPQDGLNESQDTITLDEIDDIMDVDSNNIFQNPKSDWKSHKPSDLKRPLNGELVSVTDHTAPNANKIEIMYMDAGPSRPTLSTANENLQEKATADSVFDQSASQSGRKRNSSLTPKSTNRRRPVIRTFTTSALGEKYESLADQKLELVSCLKKEHELRLKALELDIKIKEKQLNS